ncbi:MAG: type 4a pilus biogenesis protein PilO [Candidatus Aminicenantales bacterium]
MKNINVLIRTAVQRLRTEYRKSLVVSLGLFLILFIFGFLLISRFLNARLQSMDAEVRLLSSRLNYRQALIQHKDQVEKDLTSLDQNWNFMKTKVFTEASDDLAFSQIQRILDGLATMRGISIKSYKLEAAQQVGAYSVLPVSLEFSTRYEEVVTILNLIEHFSFYLKVTDLDVRSLGADENLAVRMIVEGYRYHEKTTP